MLRNVASKVMWVGRTTAALMGLAGAVLVQRAADRAKVAEVMRLAG